MELRIVFAGGGTGGHIYPALAVADEIKRKRPDTEIMFIAGVKGMERAIIENAGYTMETVDVIGMPRTVTPRLATFVWKLATSTMKARRIIRDFKPDVVMATGGYVSGPPILAARQAHVPVVIQEQNSFPGVTNRKLGRFAEKFFLGFEDARSYLPSNADFVLTGNPVRAGIDGVMREEAADAFGLSPDRRTVLVFGGSQGSRAINTVIAGCAGDIAGENRQLLWQTGQGEYEKCRKYDGLCDGRVKVLPYIDDMPSAYAVADCVVARSGAMSIAELTVCGVPAVFIPLPTAAGNHQEHNARSLEHAGAAKVIIERDLTSDLLLETLDAILESDETRMAMAGASKRFGRPEAASNIAESLIETYGK